MNRRYGFTIFMSGYFFFASSVGTDGCTITSSPKPPLLSASSYQNCLDRVDLPGVQLIGVVILCLSPVCRESTTRSTSAAFRPVEAG